MGLKQLRKEKGLTLQKLGELSGVHWVKIWQIENGKIKPERMILRNAQKLADALGCEPRDFLAEE